MAVANDGRRKRKDFSRRLENPGQPRLDRPRELEFARGSVQKVELLSCF
jgi:hypothetical protein